MSKRTKFIFTTFIVALLLALAGCGGKSGGFSKTETVVQGSKMQTCASAEPFGAQTIVDMSKCQDTNTVSWTIHNEGGCACYSVNGDNLAMGNMDCPDRGTISSSFTDRFSISCPLENSPFYFTRLVEMVAPPEPTPVTVLATPTP